MAQPPIMGWSSWNTYHVNISDSLIRRQANALVSTGLYDVGYRQVNIDDGFFGHRDAQGVMVPHERRFPNGMKPVADYIHSLGMKAGIYSDAGTNTCGSRYDNDRNGFGAGLYGHERQDARLFFHDWGFDFIKIDYCGAGTELDLDERTRYTAIVDAIKAEAGKPVSINLCRWTMPGTWAADIATSWRISPDIRPRWSSLKNIIGLNTYLSAYCHDGHYNDMDMLEMGRGLTESEEEVHMGMWCMMSSPLLIGCDLTTIPASSLRLLKNKELIAINQDTLYQQAYVALRQGEGYVFVKDLEQRHGTVRAVALYNPSDSAANFNIPLSALELDGKVTLRDVIKQKAVKTNGECINTTVAPHGIFVLKAVAERRLEPVRYEAEWGYLPQFDALAKKKKQVRYEENANASGGMVVSYLGGSSDNTLRWNNVYSKEGGRYRLTIHYVPATLRQMWLSVNGKKHTIETELLRTSGDIDSIDVSIDLRKGENAVEIGGDYAFSPDIDCITLKRLDKINTENLTVEHRTSPMGIDEQHPRFGWQITTEENDVVQTAYHIIVASTKEKARQCKGDVWDSGNVQTDSSQWVAYKGRPLAANKQYFWRVLVSTNKGKAQWSDVAQWSMGIGGDARLMAISSWIGLDTLVAGDRLERHSRMVSRCLRKTFNCKSEVRRATLHISGLGLYVASINGKRVGDGVLTPVATDYDKTVAYDTYDVTALLNANANAIGVTLAGGHYFAQTQNYQKNVRKTYGLPKLWATLIIDYANGKQDIVVSDKTWRLSTEGAVRYANEYDGELFDARLYSDFSLPNYDDSQWRQASIVEAPKGRLKGNITPQIKVLQTDRPANVKPMEGSSDADRYLIDFGTNGAGRICLRLKAAAGDTIAVRHAELLERDGKRLYTANLRSAEATARFVGDGEWHEWHPTFTYYGFRYAEISVPQSSEIDNSSIRRELLADEMSYADNQLTLRGDNRAMTLNTILTAARQGVVCNYKGMPLDCPQRDERMPWLGDRTIGSMGESYLFDCHALYSKWVADICDSQRDNGSISDVSPAYWMLYTDNVTWPAALPFTADMLYRQYGDLRPMHRSYDSIMRWLRLIHTKSYNDGIVSYDKYGDWCVPPERQDLIHSKDPNRKTDGALLSSTYYYYICRMISRYALMFGHADDAASLNAVADTTLTAINARYLSGGSYSNGTATANLLPLAMDIVPEASRADVEKALIKTIVEQNDTHVSCGVIGIGWLLRTLSDIGHCDIAYIMATNETYPSWGYMMGKGATTIWELWNGDTANPSMNSGNHVMLLGDLLPWAFERIGGIRPDEAQPGFKHFHLRPDFSLSNFSVQEIDTANLQPSLVKGSLDGVTATHRSPYGRIVSRWDSTAKALVWHIEIPANTTATIHFPNGKTKELGSGIYKFKMVNEKVGKEK